MQPPLLLKQLVQPLCQDQGILSSLQRVYHSCNNCCSIYTTSNFQWYISMT